MFRLYVSLCSISGYWGIKTCFSSKYLFFWPQTQIWWYYNKADTNRTADTIQCELTSFTFLLHSELFCCQLPVTGALSDVLLLWLFVPVNISVEVKIIWEDDAETSSQKSALLVTLFRCWSLTVQFDTCLICYWHLSVIQFDF